MEIQHFSHKHPLVFIGGVVENELIICRGCDEPISDAAYKCSQSCSFFLHKSCTELQREIRHPVHPKHPLVLIASEDRLCDSCRKSSKCSFVYQCKECEFDLDIKCASKWQSSDEDGHKHVFFPILNRIQFTCNICGEDHEGSARACTICQLLVDTYCAELARTVQIAAHKDHLLTLIFCVDNEVKEQDDQVVLCQLCFKTVNTKYGAYYCKQCTGFVAHLNCARRNSLQQFDNLDSSVYLQYLSLDSVDSATNVTKEISPEEDEGTRDILEEGPFVGGQFILTDKKLEDDKYCEVCTQLISGSFYRGAKCSGKCNIFVHDTCRNLLIKKQHLLHKHPLTLSLGEGYIGGTFICNVCNHLRHGFRYWCDKCNYSLDIHCSSIPNIIKHEAHQHSLHLAIRPYDEKCNGCDSQTNSNGAFVCTESNCNFAMGFECAILPLVVKYDQYDRHLLKLTYSIEDESGEYYCFICEEERNPRQWFYYCGECDFAAHTHCILGKYPYIKYGSTFDDNRHQHRLTFVQKTLFSPPCDICSKPFEGMGIECKQCKITFHSGLKCSGENFKNLQLINT